MSINQVGTLPPMRVDTYIPPALGWTSLCSPESKWNAHLFDTFVYFQVICHLRDILMG